jgi:hypothetical protein
MYNLDFSSLRETELIETAEARQGARSDSMYDAFEVPQIEKMRDGWLPS